MERTKLLNLKSSVVSKDQTIFHKTSYTRDFHKHQERRIPLFLLPSPSRPCRNEQNGEKCNAKPWTDEDQACFSI